MALSVINIFFKKLPEDWYLSLIWEADDAEGSNGICAREGRRGVSVSETRAMEPEWLCSSKKVCLNVKMLHAWMPWTGLFPHVGLQIHDLSKKGGYVPDTEPHCEWNGKWKKCEMYSLVSTSVFGLGRNLQLSLLLPQISVIAFFLSFFLSPVPNGRFTNYITPQMKLWSVILQSRARSPVKPSAVRAHHLSHMFVCFLFSCCLRPLLKDLTVTAQVALLLRRVTSTCNQAVTDGQGYLHRRLCVLGGFKKSALFVCAFQRCGQRFRAGCNCVWAHKIQYN